MYGGFFGQSGPLIKILLLNSSICWKFLINLIITINISLKKKIINKAFKVKILLNNNNQQITNNQFINKLNIIIKNKIYIFINNKLDLVGISETI